MEAKKQEDPAAWDSDDEPIYCPECDERDEDGGESCSYCDAPFEVDTD